MFILCFLNTIISTLTEIDNIFFSSMEAIQKTPRDTSQYTTLKYTKRKKYKKTTKYSLEDEPDKYYLIHEHLLEIRKRDFRPSGNKLISCFSKCNIFTFWKPIKLICERKMKLLASYKATDKSYQGVMVDIFHVYENNRDNDFYLLDNNLSDFWIPEEFESNKVRNIATLIRKKTNYLFGKLVGKVVRIETYSAHKTSVNITTSSFYFKVDENQFVDSLQEEILFNSIINNNYDKVQFFLGPKEQEEVEETVSPKTD